MRPSSEAQEVRTALEEETAAMVGRCWWWCRLTPPWVAYCVRVCCAGVGVFFFKCFYEFAVFSCFFFLLLLMLIFLRLLLFPLLLLYFLFLFLLVYLYFFCFILRLMLRFVQFAVQLLRNFCAITAQSLRIHFAIAAQPIRKTLYNFPRIHCAIFAQLIRCLRKNCLPTTNTYQRRRESLNLTGKLRESTAQIPNSSADCVLSINALNRAFNKVDKISMVAEAYR